MKPTVEILLLTEDTGANSRKVLEEVSRKMLHLVDGNADIQRVLFPPGGKAQEALGSNSYRENHQMKVVLVQALAERLLRKPDASFAIVHIDGDRTWEASGSGTTGTRGEGAFDFRDLVLPALQQTLRDHGRGDPIREAEYLSRLNCLFLAIPYKHMEAWLYQNTDVLRQIYKSRYSLGHRDLKTIACWEKHPELLDEEANPKETLTVHDSENLKLAESFRAAKVQKVGKSFAATVEQLSGSESLRNALAEIRHPAS